MKKETVGTLTVVLLSTALWLVSMVIAKKDTSFTYRWVTLTLHYLSFIPVISLFAWEHLGDRNWKNLFKKENSLPFLFVLLVACISYFIFLGKYPFVSAGDELRDSGLLATKIESGEIKNIFGYGEYNGYGLDPSILAAFSYRLFGGSVLTYRLPSALLATLEVVMVYLLGYLILGKRVAFWAAMVLAALPLQLMLARTELLVLFNSFLTAAILLFFYFLKDKRVINFAIFSIILGFSSGFHTAVRAVALIMLFIGILFVFFPFGRKNIKEGGVNLLVLTLFCLIGFGPRLLFTTRDIFFAKQRFYVQDSKQQNLFGKFNELGERYYHSFLSWTAEPLQNRTVENKPILTPLLSILFIVGLVMSLMVWENLYLKVVSFLAIILPFSNSALTDTLNQGHRLSPLLPIGAILISVGIVAIQQKISQRIIRSIFGFVILFYLLFQIFFFFYHQPISKSAELKDYLSMHLIYFLKSHPKLTSGRICLKVSPTNWQNLDLMHYKEQYAYFFPNLKIERFSDSAVSDDEIFVGTNEECESPYISLRGGQRVLSVTDNLFKISCGGQKDFTCPQGYSGEIKIHY